MGLRSWKALDFKKWRGWSLGALQKFTPIWLFGVDACVDVTGPESIVSTVHNEVVTQFYHSIVGYTTRANALMCLQFTTAESWGGGNSSMVPRSYARGS